MISNSSNKYDPDYTVPPGEILEEILEARGIKKKDFASRCGLSAKTVSQIIKGKAPITQESAIKFKRVLNISASIWNNLESNYRLFLARKADERNIREKIDWLKEFPIKELKKWEFINETENEIDTVKELLNFFGEGNINTLKLRIQKMEAAYRSSKAFESNPKAVATWLRMGEKIAENIDCNEFNLNRFQSSIKKIRQLTVKNPEEFCPEIKQILSEAGVAMVFLPELPKTRLFGATKWISPVKALIMNSLRYKTNDHFWFTLFHEIAHILLHGKKEKFVDSINEEKTEKEKEADSFAANILIDKNDYEKFTSKNEFDKKSIIDFANKIKIAPGIVVGRLQHNKFISFKTHNDLKVKYKFTNYK